MTIVHIKHVCFTAQSVNNLDERRHFKFWLIFGKTLRSNFDTYIYYDYLMFLVFLTVDNFLQSLPWLASPWLASRNPWLKIIQFTEYS